MWSVGMLGGLWLLFGAGWLGVRLVERHNDREMVRFDRAMRSFGDAVASPLLDGPALTYLPPLPSNPPRPGPARRRNIRLVLLAATTSALAWHLVVVSKQSATVLATALILATSYQAAAMAAAVPRARRPRDVLRPDRAAAPLVARLSAGGTAHRALSR